MSTRKAGLRYIMYQVCDVTEVKAVTSYSIKFMHTVGVILYLHSEFSANLYNWL